MTTEAVPFVDLKAAHAEIADEVAEGFEGVLSSAGFVGGPHVTAFEQEYAQAGTVGHCIGVANGTDAIELALRAVGVGPGDEVVLPANTFVATAEAVARAGATVVLADNDPATYLVDVAAVGDALTERTRAIIPVHLYGQMAFVEQFRGLAEASGVTVVEDAAQSQGASRFGRRAGQDSIAATSFYPGKNLGAYGDAGAVVTDDEALARRVREMSQHGSLTRYVHDVVGMNSRLDALQAVVLRAKLRRLDEWNDRRRAAAARYDDLLDGLDLVRPVEANGNHHVWHLYVVRLPDDSSPKRRDQVIRELAEAGVNAAIHYPTPVHLTDAFASLGYAKGDFPHAEAGAERIFSLPMYPHITAEQQQRVADALHNALGRQLLAA